MRKETFAVQDKEVTLYPADTENAPLIILNTYTGDGGSVYEAMQEIECPECNLAVVGNLKWDHDMTPWYAPPLSAEDTPCTGGADDYIALLTEKILPEVKSRIAGVPEFTGISGYSLAGLFAVYAMYRTDVFDRAASMSGSLWFPDFKEYALTHEIQKRPAKLYLSLGDREAHTRNSVLMTVQRNTEELVDHYKSLGLEVTWELNPGNHFRDAALRSAKGIKAILE